jgi:hypothetical protein
VEAVALAATLVLIPDMLRCSNDKFASLRSNSMPVSREERPGIQELENALEIPLALDPLGDLVPVFDRSPQYLTRTSIKLTPNVW